MKKFYTRPTLTTIKLQQQTALLQGSVMVNANRSSYGMVKKDAWADEPEEEQD